MRIFDTFTKRQKKNRGKVPDTYQYANLPVELRTQIVYIVRDAIGRGEEDQYGFSPASVTWWRVIEQTLLRERGVFELAKGQSPAVRCMAYLMGVETDGALDMIDLCFHMIDTEIRSNDAAWGDDVQFPPDSAIAELNHRMKEHGVGYEFVAGELRRIDSQYIHAQAVKPALERRIGARPIIGLTFSRVFTPAS